MACCAFALYLVSQLLLPIAWLRDRLGLARAAAPSATVLWSPYAPSPSGPSPSVVTARPRPRLLRPAFLGILALELGAAGAVAAYARTDPPPETASAFEQALHQAICTIRSAA